MEYRSRLSDLAKNQGRNSRLAMVGAGQMGRGFALQAVAMGALDVSVVAARTEDSIRRAYADLGITDVLVSNDPVELNAAIAAGRATGTTDAVIVAQLDVDVVVEATGVPEVGARVVSAALRGGKHVAVLNVEMDVTIGPILTKIARDHGVIYSVCRGDEPVEALKLFEFARDLSFEVVCAGKGKNNPFKPHMTPDLLVEEANFKRMNPRMLCEFVDGSKTMIEMAALSNLTGLPLTKRGMIGPASSVKTLHETFRPVAEGGVLEETGVVDYCTGDVAPGVFVVVKSDKPYVAHELWYLGLGEGPYFTFYRPYHIASIEAPLTVAEILIDKQATFAATTRIAEVVAMTKRAHVAGEKFDGIGGYSVRAFADRAADAKRDGLVPIGLLAGAVAKRDLPIDHLVTWDDVEVDSSQEILRLYREMEALGL